MIYNWKWENLPKHEHNKVIDHIQMGMIGHLMNIHNKYELSEEIFCCPHHVSFCNLWFMCGFEYYLFFYLDV